VQADVLGPLPQGTVVLEASAGTGKTWTIAALATRYVAEAGLPLSQLMLVTFGRAATQELRERTRQRLTASARGLADPVAARAGDDALLAHLATGTDAEVALRRRRLVAALSDFDAATITTTHSFCQRMLDGLGIAGDRDLGADVVESLDDLVTEVADDLYLRQWSGHESPLPELSPADARAVAREAVQDRQALLEPADATPGSAAGQRIWLARAAREEVERRKRATGVRDFDDLLVLLRDALADPVHGAASCARVRERYRVVLVDEFQDTDPVQWEVLRRAFHGSTTLVLIGDPKQAIYAFRGAEVLSYLDAVRLADRHETLGTNHRSDADLVRALDALYGGAAWGTPTSWCGRCRRGTRARGCRARCRCACAGSTAPAQARWARAAPRPSTRCASGWPPTSPTSWCGCSAGWSCRPPTGRGRCARATSRCWCASGCTSPRCGRRSTAWASRRSWPAPPASSRPRAPPTGCGSCRRSSSRTAPAACGWPR
jgi:exodeoxyribonuclease V beta subunit